MLTYHQAFDSYHCFIRIISFLMKGKVQDHDIDSIRIFDFYFCVPSALINFKFPQELRRYRKLFKDKTNHYNDVPNQRELFFELKLIQNSAFDQMISLGLIDYDLFHKGKVSLVRDKLPAKLETAIEMSVSIDSDVREFVLGELVEIPLLGVNGLKDRSGLMDYRYDLV